MNATVVNAVRPAPDRRTVARRFEAKDTPETDRKSVYRARLGHAIHRARMRCDWNLQEFAREMGDRDERQMACWESGEKPAQFDVLFAHDAFRPQLIIALAELSSDSIEIETVVKVRRRV